MLRFVTFLAVLAVLVVYFHLTSRPRAPREPALKAKLKRAPKKTYMDEFWVQVYDTDSVEEARKIQIKFHDMNVQCFLYEQGKKDVYGTVLKHYGISVTRHDIEKAQAILSQITL